MMHNQLEITTPSPVTPTYRRVDTTQDISDLLARVSETLNDNSPNTGDQLSPAETEAVLRLALVAMTEAEKRIERQQRRIDYLESLSVTDELTGLVNRRGFRADLKKAFAAAQRDGGTGVVIMIDLDHFKQVNDTYGHAAGDALLVSVADVLKNQVRESDTVARLGGDEFAVIMPGADPNEAAQRVARLNKALNTRILYWEGEQIPIQASLGSELFTDSDTEEGLMHRADHQMYAAKSARKSTAIHIR